MTTQVTQAQAIAILEALKSEAPSGTDEVWQAIHTAARLNGHDCGEQIPAADEGAYTLFWLSKDWGIMWDNRYWSMSYQDEIYY